MMKTIKLLALFGFALFLASCNNDDDGLAEFTITSINPTSGTVGTEVIITGADFPMDASAIDISFGGVSATITSTSATQIVTSVPSGATSGEVEIVANGFTRSATNDFTVLSERVSATVSNLHAPATGGFGADTTGPFTKFDFETGMKTDSDTEWDIAFRTTQIIVNGGTSLGTDSEPERNGNAAAVIIDGLFDEVAVAPAVSEFAQDSAEGWAITASSDQGWYNYNFMTNVVSPLPGKVLVFRTRDGKYAKVEILSYYKDAPVQPDGFVDEARYYTFKYVYNPNDGETSLQ